MNESSFEEGENKIWGKGNLSRERIRENKGKKGKKRKPYPKFPPCNGYAALELQGGIVPGFGRQRSAPKPPFPPLKYLHGLKLSCCGEIPSAGLSATTEGLFCFPLTPGFSLYSMMIFFSFSLFFFFGRGGTLFFASDIKQFYRRIVGKKKYPNLVEQMVLGKCCQKSAWAVRAR